MHPELCNSSNQIERVLDGRVVNANCIQNEHARRGIRKLCGRQVLVDMLKMAERERQRELEGLMQHHAVSNFAHRNRIQVRFNTVAAAVIETVDDKDSDHHDRNSDETSKLHQRFEGFNRKNCGYL